MKTIAVPTRIQIKNILFATDFSQAAQAALPFAAQIAERFGAKLFAVHARTPGNYALPTTEIWPVANAEVEQQTEALRETMHARFPSIESEVLIGEGGIRAVIEKVIEEKNIDLLVLGTRGRRGIGKFLLGSVAEEILRRAKCPVLTVGPQSTLEAAREGKFRRIVYATDFERGATAAAAYAIGLAEEHQAHLTLLHVIEHHKAGELVTPHELEGAALQHLRRLVPPEAELWCEPRFVVREGAPAEKILEMAEKEEADLIVIGVRESKGIVRAAHLPTAVAHQVITHAVCPVMTIGA